ncbi:MAG TPA: response regulator [Dissulfurispiraceae bacterium]|nr:response regulator [Dissulfurispiraceae bacterium]
MNVIIIDDTLSNLVLLRGLTERVAGCHPHCFDSPVEALSWCEVNKPDVVITDYMMPGMDGIEFIRRFRRQKHHALIPIIMVTAHGEQEILQSALMCGATDFITKPVDGTEFVDRLKSIIALRNNWTQAMTRAVSDGNTSHGTGPNSGDIPGGKGNNRCCPRTSRIFHEIFNNLGVITGFSDFLLMKMDDGGPSTSYVRRMLTASEQATCLVRELHDLVQEERDHTS